MVKSAATTVDEWMAEVDPTRRPYFEQVRALALKHLTSAVEEMRYGCPCYVRPIDPVPCFAYQSQKGYLSLYVNPKVSAGHAEALKGADPGKSCLRFRKGDKIDMALLAEMLAETEVLPPIEYKR